LGGTGKGNKRLSSKSGRDYDKKKRCREGRKLCIGTGPSLFVGVVIREGKEQRNDYPTTGGKRWLKESQIESMLSTNFDITVKY